MRYPVMRVKRDAVLGNARKVVELCAQSGIDVWGVTKGMAGHPELANIYAEAGCRGVADSRCRNLAGIKDAKCPLPRQLIRVAMPSELNDIPDAAMVSLQSEASTILALDEICASRGTTHEVLMMLDIGDLREGFWPRELPGLKDALAHLRGGVQITGVAANFACASGVLPSRDKMNELLTHRDTLQEVLGYELPTVSVGGTCCLKLLEDGLMPKGINQLRICEGIALGVDTAFMRDIPYLDRDTILITAEIVECKHKPSVPNGEIGLQAFGEKPIFVDRGIRKRALLGIGRQDVNMDRLTPMNEGVHIITASSDHMIVDITEADSMKPTEQCYHPGDTLSFRPLYPAMLAAATSAYVDIRFE